MFAGQFQLSIDGKQAASQCSGLGQPISWLPFCGSGIWTGLSLGFLGAQTEKNLPVMQEAGVQSLGWEDLLEKGLATHSHILPGDFHGQKNLAGYSLWDCKESETTE